MIEGAEIILNQKFPKVPPTEWCPLEEKLRLKETEDLPSAPLGAVVVCGMGMKGRRLMLREETPLEREVDYSAFAQHNAIAAKMLAIAGLTERSILSGRSSSKTSGSLTEAEIMHGLFKRVVGMPAVRREAEELKRQAEAAGKSEEEVSRMAVQHIIDRKTEMTEAIKVASDQGEEDPEAKNTIYNIIGAINRVDQGGLYKGSFAVGSSEWHLPRIADLLEIMGIKNSMVLSSQAVLEHFGFNIEMLYPSQADYARMSDEKVPGKHKVLAERAKTWGEYMDKVWREQKRWLFGVRLEPGVLVPELEGIKSDERLKEVIKNVASWYENHEAGEKFRDLGVNPEVSALEIREQLKLIKRKEHVDRVIAIEELSFFNDQELEDFRRVVDGYRQQTLKWLQVNTAKEI